MGDLQSHEEFNTIGFYWGLQRFTEDLPFQRGPNFRDETLEIVEVFRQYSYYVITNYTFVTYVMNIYNDCKNPVHFGHSFRKLLMSKKTQ